MTDILDEPTPEAKTEAKRKADLLAKARAHFKDASEWWADNRKKWLEDAKFRVIGQGNQWPDDIKKYREDNKLPCLEVDKLNQYIHQVVNDGRQNRPAVKVRPIDDHGDVEIAEALQGLIRHICDRSNADEAFDKALEDAATGGFGFFRVLTEYASERTFNQELIVRRVANALSCLISRHDAADGSDTTFGFFYEDIQKEAYKKQYPNAKVVDWNADGFKDDWSAEKTVRVAEYWYKVETLETLHLLADNTVASQEEYDLMAAEGSEPPPAIKDTRQIPACSVKWCRLSGAEVLEERDWLGKYIPIIPVYGNEQNIEGKVVLSGLIRPAADPQRLYNFSRSAFAQRVAMTTKAPWMAAAEQVADYPEWETANVGNHSILRYKHLSEDGTVIPPPQRISPSDVPAGFSEDMQLAEHDIQAALGMYNASLGERSNEKSGKAIMARQREGDTATFHYQDNLNRAIRYLGRILVDAAPKYYDSKRVVRILGEDGTSSMAWIDPHQKKAVERQGSKVIYNIGVGEYDVSVAAGPSYTTKRQEAAEGMMQLVQAAPETMQFAGDIVVKTLDWPGADDLAERYKLMLPPPIQQALENTDESPEVANVRAQAKQMMDQQAQQMQELQGMAQQQAEELQAAQSQLAAEKANREVEGQKVQVDMLRAQNERMKIETEAAKPPEDNTIEYLRLQKEDEWKKLDAETKVIVAQISASAKPAPGEATMPGAMPDEPENPDELPLEEIAEPAEPPVDQTALALTAALEGFTQALSQMRAPRTAVLSDGRKITLQ